MGENKVTNNLTIENAGIILKNFQGKETIYNAAGNRKFGLLLDDNLAESLKEDGWPVKYLKPREDDPDQHEQAWMEVKVKYGKVPPTAYIITSKGKIKLDEETIGQLDWAYFESVDVIVRPYNYPAIAGRPAGISAYLKAIYVTIREDDLSMKYGDIPEFE